MDIEEEIKPIEGFDVRYTIPEDAEYLAQWFSEPGILRWFPMTEPPEIDDSVKRWISFSKYNCSITGLIDGVPCGIATLYLQPYRKLIHQCEFGIIVGTGYRGKGIGTHLMRNLMNLAKNYFKIEVLHLQVYAENPAIHLYYRFGFREFGRQTHWLKDDGVYSGRVFMERFL
jgi:RimJ/RimL family protein N-acetyltransferase